MSKCAACNETIPRGEKIVCSINSCAKSYHLLCVGLNSEKIKRLSPWTCPACVAKQRKTGDNSNTPVKVTGETSGPAPRADLDQLNAALRADLLFSLRSDLSSLVKDAIREQMDTLTEKISSIETSVNFISAQYEDIMKMMTDNKVQIKGLREENQALRAVISKHSEQIKHLEEENSRQQQWNRLQNVEITGVPELKNENTTEIVLKVMEKVGVSSGTTELEFAHRVQARRPTSLASGRTIVVRFRNRRTKDAVIAASRKTRGLSLSDIGMVGDVQNNNNRIYVNEHLTKQNKSLLKECKNKAKENNFKYVWTKNCQIFVRRTETSPPISIITTADLEKMC